MAEQLKSGQWLARRVESGGTALRMFKTEEEAEAWEQH